MIFLFFLALTQIKHIIKQFVNNLRIGDNNENTNTNKKTNTSKKSSRYVILIG